MAKHVKGSAISGATAYELYTDASNGITVRLSALPHSNYEMNKAVTSSNHIPSYFEGAYTLDFPIEEDYVITFPANSAKRGWIVDENGNPIRTFSNKDTNYVFTAKPGDKIYRLSVMEDIIPYATGTIQIKANKVLLKVQDNGNDIDFDMTDSGLQSGSYSLTVKATADDKEDSDYSNAVTYTV